MSKIIKITLTLIYLALWKTDDILTYDNFNHNNNDGKTLDERRAEIGYTGYVGEVLYKGPCSIKNAVELWSKNETHNEVIDNDYPYAVFIMVPSEEDSDICYIIGEYSK